VHERRPGPADVRRRHDAPQRARDRPRAVVHRQVAPKPVVLGAAEAEHVGERTPRYLAARSTGQPLLDLLTGGHHRRADRSGQQTPQSSAGDSHAGPLPETAAVTQVPGARTRARVLPRVSERPANRLPPVPWRPRGGVTIVPALAPLARAGTRRRGSARGARGARANAERRSVGLVRKRLHA
jgi:hypothetical protein